MDQAGPFMTIATTAQAVVASNELAKYLGQTSEKDCRQERKKTSKIFA
jgi:hypothetical protein